MNVHVYRWDLQASRDVRLEFQIEAPSAIAARREMKEFLRSHGGSEWRVVAVSRENVAGSSSAGLLAVSPGGPPLEPGGADPGGLRPPGP